MGGDDTPLLQVVGVVGDVRGISLDKAPTMTVYVPYWQRFQSQALLAVRTPLDPGVVAPDLRRALRRVDPELPVPAFRTMEDIVSVSVAERRFQTSLVMLFGLVAALLASLGIYGVVSYSVAQRTGELGIRMALGARARGPALAGAAAVPGAGCGWSRVRPGRVGHDGPAPEQPAVRRARGRSGHA